jgi:hypothetical protein
MIVDQQCIKNALILSCLFMEIAIENGVGLTLLYPSLRRSAIGVLPRDLRGHGESKELEVTYDCSGRDMVSFLRSLDSKVLIMN